MDTAFVSRAIEEHRLEPSPVAGFNADPTYWMETERWKRVVERYPWGAVIFMTDRKHARAATVIAIGKVDLDKGRVTTQGGQQPITVGWYHEMVSELKQAQQPDQLQIPPCLGYRKADHICDGGLNRAIRKVEPACAWRERCIVLQEHAANTNRQVEQVLQGKSPTQVIQLTTRLLERAGKAEAKPVERHDHKPVKQPAAAKPKPVAPTRQPAVPAAKEPDGFREQLIANVSTFTASVAAAAGLKVALGETKQNALDGELYLVNRVHPSGYISLYQAATPDHRALAVFRIRPRVGGYNIQLAIPPTSDLFHGVEPTDIRPFKDGKFLSIVNNCPPEGRRMDHIRRILLAMLEAK
jgi:hypothetical protein